MESVREKYCIELMRISTNCTYQIKKFAWIHQHGATSHIEQETMAYLHTSFGNRIWSLKAEHEWCPHSPDFSPFDFFFWSVAKGEGYQEKPRFLRQLKQAIKPFTQSITTGTYRQWWPVTSYDRDSSLCQQRQR